MACRRPAALRRTDPHADAADGLIPPLDRSLSGFHSLALPGDVHLRLLQRAVQLVGEPLVLRAALRENDFARGLTVVLWVMAAALPVALLVAGGCGYWLAKSGLAPIERMAHDAERIHAGRLDARLPVDNAHDEPGRLAIAFNALLARLEAAFDQLRRFTADASHELRTPLAVIRSVGEVGLRQPHCEAEYRDIIGTILEEIDRLTLLTTTPLELTRADGGQAAIKREPFDLRELAGDAAGLIGTLAEEARVRIDLDLPATPVPFSGDWTMLRQALVNLLDNAVKHSPPEAAVSLALRVEADGIELTVADRGDGIPADQLPRIFDRFYRVDAARSRQRGGFGLGLAIARWAVEAHGGHIEAESAVGKGSLFRIRLPRAPAPAGTHQGDRP